MSIMATGPFQSLEGIMLVELVKQVAKALMKKGRGASDCVVRGDMSDVAVD